MSEAYAGVVNELNNRILALIPDNPQILTMTDAWGMFKVPGFKYDDLEPSAFQAGWAFVNARQRWKAAKAAQPLAAILAGAPEKPIEAE